MPKPASAQVLQSPIEVIDLYGNPRTRGRNFGTQRRRQIRAFIDDWLSALRKSGITDPHRYVATFMRDRNFLPAIEEKAPDLLEEVQGLAAGADQPLQLLLAAQFMDEEWSYRSSFLSGETMQKCSSLAIRSAEGFTWIGQTMDLGDYTDGHQVVIRIAPHEHQPGTLIFTVDGMMGLLGVNAHGVGVCVNSLPLLPSAREGLPVAFVIRKLLQSRSVDEAVQTLKAVRHATSQHYLIAGFDSIRSFEVSSAGINEYHSPYAGRVLHTNHSLSEEKGATEKVLYESSTAARLRSLSNRLSTGSPDVEAIKAALSAADDPKFPVCKLGGRATTSFTTGSMISLLQPGASAVKAWISSGPPCLRGYNEVTLPSVM